MVLKPVNCVVSGWSAFESSVNSDGTQTLLNNCRYPSMFESSVNSDGTQTSFHTSLSSTVFESSVNSDGTQTCQRTAKLDRCLRAV